MRFLTHVVGGLLVGSLFFDGYMTVGAALAATLPDIDHPKSKLRMLGPFSVVATALFRHRGVLHAVWLPLLLVVLFPFSVMAAAGAAGYASHLALDALTPAGIRPFAPLTKWKICGSIQTGSWNEYALLAMLAFVLVMTL